MKIVLADRNLAVRNLAAAAGMLIAVAGPVAHSRPQTTDYDPLVVADAALPAPVDMTVHDDARDREIPVRVYLPAGVAASEPTPAPVVLFSHGLGGARTNNPYLGRHWAGRGYVVVFVQHPGSDEAVWRDVPAVERMSALRDAASARNFLLRTADVPQVLDQLAIWNAAEPAAEDDSHETAADALVGRLDLAHVGMSGHSFGALTTQAVSGQTFAAGRRSLTDKRIKAAVMFSPSAPRLGDAGNAFSAVPIPWLLMTGTRDEARIGGQTVAMRRAVFPALPAGAKYELVLDKAEHSAFGDRALPGDSEPRNPNHHRAILAISTAFWDAYLRGDEAARAWLDGAGPRSVLEEPDQWQTK